MLAVFYKLAHLKYIVSQCEMEMIIHALISSIIVIHNSFA